EPDGQGPSLAKRTIYSPGDEPTSWIPSAQAGGTPGTANFPGGPPPRDEPFAFGGDIVINEICYHVPSRYATDESQYLRPTLQWIELHNRGAAPAEIGGWTIRDGIAMTIPAGTT